MKAKFPAKWIAFLLSTAWIAALWVLRGEPGLVWDEPPLVERHLAMSAWLSDLWSGGNGRESLFAEAVLERGWPFCREAPHEHPPVQALCSWLTGTASGWLLGPIRSIRLATVLGYALLTASVFGVVRPRWGNMAAWSACAFVWFQPRFVGDCELATFDGLAATAYFLAAVVFLKSCNSRKHFYAFGIVAGIAVMTKATCILVVFAMAFWALICGIRVAWKPLLLCVVLGPLTAVAINPGWWTRPVAGPTRWVKAILNYSQHVPTHYLGKTYDQADRKTPWHKPAVIWATTVPAPWLVLLGAGTIFGVTALTRRSPSRIDEKNLVSNRQVVAWALFGGMAAPVAQAIGILPGHDGMRQLASMQPFLAVLAGSTVGVIRQHLSSRPMTNSLATGCVAVLIGMAAVSTWQVQPHSLDFYGAQVGGARGAQRLGMETTYYWDAVNSDVLDWLNRELPPDSKLILFPPPDVRCFDWYRRWGMLRDDIQVLQFDDPFVMRKLALMIGDSPCYLLFLMREGKFISATGDKYTPFQTIAGEKALFEVVPPALGVRLVAIYDREDFRKRIWPKIEQQLNSIATSPNKSSN